MPADDVHLFTPLTLRGVAMRNRVWVSPMCQYSVFNQDGVATDWHLVHLGSRATGGAGLVMVEATAVEPRGRISAQDLGLWDDAQGDALARVVRFLAEHGATPAIQIAHAGRKAGVAGAIAPSPIPFSEQAAVPQEMSLAEIQDVTRAFVAAANRALAAGFQVVEIHAAHGYLLHEFLSPISNQRSDSYGGSFANRARFLLAVTEAVRGVWPERLPLFVRLSATDWVSGGWDVEQSVALAALLRERGVDLIDVSSGGASPAQQIKPGPGYQVPFAARIRRAAGIPTAAVGLITEPQQADAIVRVGDADAVFIGRQSLRDPYWPLRAARALGYATETPFQYQRGW
ncbi:MAG: NADPH dehydrogenase [Chloroflexi bacterium ADurb.Bin325]|nr:MAG: NADPH dehydrogenase [Chloroflexi bacterium ADurb.Bin325]